MATLVKLTKQCGTPEPKGTKQLVYVIPISEITGFPQTREEVVLAASGTPVAGDSKILDEAWDLAAAAVGLGYWRSAPVLVNTGDVNNIQEGEIGGETVTNEINGFIPSNSSATKEFIDCIQSYSGCLIAMIEDKSGRFQVVGNRENPVYVQTPNGGTGGDRVGFQFRLFSETGFTNMEYDGATHGVDVSPNV